MTAPDFNANGETVQPSPISRRSMRDIRLNARDNAATALMLSEKGYSSSEIAEKLGITDRHVRRYLYTSRYRHGATLD